jgi:hypothetical protein
MEDKVESTKKLEALCLGGQLLRITIVVPFESTYVL